MTVDLRSLLYTALPPSYSTAFVSGGGAVVTCVFFSLVCVTGYLAYEIYFKGNTNIKAPEAPAMIKAA